MKTLAIAVIALVVGSAVWAGPVTSPTHLASLVGEAAAQAGPSHWYFGKIHLRFIPHELVWFNGREGDLEHHAIERDGAVCITLTDLIRHLSGSLIWGPHNGFIQVRRGGMTVRVFPGTDKVEVNGQAKSLGVATFRKDNLLWVPVKATAALFGATSQWKSGPRRLDVTWQQ